MAATVKHLKQFEKIFLGIRDSADEKLAHLKSEFLDHQEWLRKAVVDTKESKYGRPPGPPTSVHVPFVLCHFAPCAERRLVLCCSPLVLRLWRARRLQGRARPRVSRDCTQGQGRKLAHRG